MANNLTFSSFVEEFIDSAFKLKSSVNGSLDGLPGSLISVIQTSVMDENDDLENIEEAVRQFGGGGGCNDAYSAFGFLSFLFALLTFIQNNMRRRKRDTRTEVKHENSAFLEIIFSPISQLFGSLLSSDYREALLASGLMYHGYLRSLSQVSSLTSNQKNKKQKNDDPPLSRRVRAAGWPVCARPGWRPADWGAWPGDWGTSRRPTPWT